MLHLLCVLAIVAAANPGSSSSLELSITAQEQCAAWKDCQEQALAAAASGEYERFHDLAWRAVQKGPKNDPALMTMLARAQSLSGRPHDALVMLQRLAALGVVTDAADSEDFRRVRALPGWADFQSRIAEQMAAAPAIVSPPGAATVKTGSKPPAGSPAAAAAPDAVRPRPDTPSTPSAPDERRPAEEAAATGGEAAEAVRFAGEAFTPAGLAYDAVSNRFIVADRGDRKLVVIGERSQRMSNLVGAESGGFGEIGGMAIDVRQGDLWVASTGSGESTGARLHKLQLISGRHLMTVSPDPVTPPARFVDVAIAADGSVLALDGPGRRVFRQPPALHDAALRVAATLDVTAPVSIAPAPDGAVYVAHAEGVSRVDLQSSGLSRVSPGKGVSLTGLTWIRWHRGRLVGVQKSGNADRIVRIRLDGSGKAATRVDVLQRGVALPDGASSVAIAGDMLYYLTSVAAADAVQHVVRRIEIK